MKLYEYQSYELLEQYQIPTPGGILAENPNQAGALAEQLVYPVVVKAQVHTGGRGKAGGIRLARHKQELIHHASEILNMHINGLKVRKLFIVPAIPIHHETYLSLVVDRNRRGLSFIACSEGGIEIEQIAKQSPEKILRWNLLFQELSTLSTEQTVPFASQLASSKDQVTQIATILKNMAKLFCEKDCSLLEINPLVTDNNGKVMALDAKIIIDDNSLFRHPELMSYFDKTTEDADEIAAKEHGLSFVRLDGNIGCIVNGAGLAMATMDIIKHYGGTPANFLDVGGSSDPQKVVAAFQLLLKNPNIKVILINIFGGITRCDDIATGIVQSLEHFHVHVPLIVRLVGTNEAQGREILHRAHIIPVATLDEGAAKAAELARNSHEHTD